MTSIPCAAVALAACAWLIGAPAARAAPSADFAIGTNAENQPCRAVARFDAPRGASAADIYCGRWEQPSGLITVYRSGADADAALAGICQGAATGLAAPDFSDLRQVACAQTGDGRVRRYVLVARRGPLTAIGNVYPSDWAPLVTAARVLTGAAKPTTAGAAEAPGLDEIRAVFPAGVPGQGAEANYELLRRRAYEYNMIWSFGSSQRDFEQLLQAHRKTAPDDVDGEAEILAEIGLNMSSARRFEEAAQVLNGAEARARAANDALLVSKVTNYRAIDQLNQRHFGAALRQALAANRARADLASSHGNLTSRIDASDVRQVDSRLSDVSHRSLLISLSENSPADRAAILSAQGAFIAGVAARGLGDTEAAARDLAQAANGLLDVDAPPAWLVGAIASERADLALSKHDYAGAVAAAQSGLATIRTVAAGTRSEAHMWLALEAAEDAQGRTQEALASGRTAMSIYAREGETPGLPADVAATHLGILEREWRRTGDSKLASEYFEDLALVWDGAAARTTAQLAARLVVKSAGPEARAYQDAERAYRSTYARRQSLAGDPDANQATLAQADAAVRTSAAGLADAEAKLREKAPSYLELLSPQVSTDDVRAVLADHEGYLRIAIGSEGGYGALVDRQGVHPFLISMTGSQVDALVDRVRRSTRLRGRALPDYDLQAAAQLYAALIAPVQDQLAQVQDLDLDVSGALASAPFAAFVVSPPTPDQLENVKSGDYTGIDWLARHVSIANALGPAAFVRLRKEPPPAIAELHAAIYGDFRPDPATMAERLAKQEGLSESCEKQVERALAALGALPETADEARGIAASFASPSVKLGADFTDVDFMTSQDAANADVIVLATHGVLAISSCFAEPALVASVGSAGDGLIQASQLLDRKLRARLVVLSACDTAAGGKLDEARTGLGDGGDALSGLARGFIYAGARDVMATEWKVDAAASGAEISAMLAEASKGVSLRKALSDSEASLYGAPETAHPFYWAPFVLVGDGGGVLAPAPTTTAAGG